MASKCLTGALAALGGTVLAALAVVVPTSAEAEQRVVKLGLFAFVSGALAAEGEEQIRGAQLAVDELNAAADNPFRYELVVGDVREQSSEAVVSAFERLSSDPDVHVMLGTYPSTTNFEIDYMAEAEMVYLIGGNSEQTRAIIEPNPDGYPTVWSLAPDYKAYGTVPPVRLEEMQDEGAFVLGNRKVAIIASDNAWSMAMYDDLKPGFESLGWEITLDEVVPFVEISDWRPILSQIRQDPPDVIFYIDYAANNAAIFQNQFMEDPTPSIMISVYPPSIPEYRQLTGRNSNGVLADIMMYPVEYEGYDAWPRFQERFKEEFGVETGSQGAVVYELVMLYHDALQEVGNPEDRQAIANVVRNIEKDTMFGFLRFDPDTHLSMQGEDYFPLQFLQVWDGEIYTFWPTRYANGKFRTPPWME